VPGQLDALSAYLQRVAVAKGDVRRRPGRVAVTEQQPPGLLMPDPDGILEQRGGPAVVGVVMGINQVLLRPSAAAISSTARRRLWPMLGGASNSTTPSRVTRNADW
jgi:hypothetical protein